VRRFGAQVWELLALSAIGGDRLGVELEQRGEMGDLSYPASPALELPTLLPSLSPCRFLGREAGLPLLVRLGKYPDVVPRDRGLAPRGIQFNRYGADRCGTDIQTKPPSLHGLATSLRDNVVLEIVSGIPMVGTIGNKA
jgi:hypothetical protein